MCGIAGIVTSDIKIKPLKKVNTMLELLKHRGPDQVGAGEYKNYSIGMTRLSIIDQSIHEIPYTDPSGKYFVVYNGEIYNHDEIRRSLKGKFKYKTRSDAETVLYNYIEKGVKSFKDYNGMYAFAILDLKKDKLFIVRDKTGEKPLYYAQGKDHFSFASEIKCLLELVKPKLNKNAVSYRAYEFTVGSETLFEGIYALEPGEYLEVDPNGYEVKEYWKVWNELIDVKDDEAKILKDLTELLEDSIMLRTRNCVHEHGCFVSGGLDSSLVAAIAKPDYIYTVHYEYDDFNELDYAKILAKRIKRDLVIVTPTKEDFLRTRRSIARSLDTPCTWTSFSLWMLMERAKKDLKVVMTGDGADELFAGYHRYHLLHHDEQIHQLEAMEKYSYLIDRYYGSAAERYAKLVNRCENRFDEEVNKYLFSSIEKYFGKMDNDIVHAMGLNDMYSTMQVLLQMSDRIAMAFSIENRSPFLDHRLVQYAFSMPSKYKIRDGVTKWALKKIAEKFVPREITDRIDKRGFSAPINRWFEWEESGKYNRTAYKNMVYEDWRDVFKVKG